jgi:hypothetical protein
MIFKPPNLGRQFKCLAFFLILAGFVVVLSSGCSQFGYGSDPAPEPVELPTSPVERAAILGLQTSYRGSTQWQIQRPMIINVAPVAPTAAVLREQDPKELYCVCVEYEARYKVAWSTADGSAWERTIRNILVMKTQSDHFIALRPLNICPPLCE